MVKSITELKYMTTWQMLDYMIFDELSEEFNVSCPKQMNDFVFIYRNKGKEKIKRSRTYETNIFVKLEKLFPNEHGAIRAKQEEIFEGTLAVWRTNNGHLLYIIHIVVDLFQFSC